MAAKPKPAKGAFLKKPSQLFPTNSPRFLLHKHLNGPQPGRGRTRVHASEVTKDDGLCPRLYALFDAGAYKLADERLTTAESITFEIGRMVQDAVIHHFADMGRAIGDWKCLACSALHTYGLRPEACSECGCRAFKPEEIRYTSAKSGVSCGVDMHLVRPGLPHLPVEIKTMNPEDFKALVAPLGEHRLRTNLYLRLISESLDPFAAEVDQQAGVVLYISKGGFGIVDETLKAKWGLPERFSPLKEFPVKRDDKLTESVLKAALVVQAHRAGLAGMPKGVCSTSLGKRATYCEGRTPCFSGDYPATHDWKTAA